MAGSVPLSLDEALAAEKRSAPRARFAFPGPSGPPVAPPTPQPQARFAFPNDGLRGATPSVPEPSGGGGDRFAGPRPSVGPGLASPEATAYRNARAAEAAGAARPAVPAAAPAPPVEGSRQLGRAVGSGLRQLISVPSAVAASTIRTASEAGARPTENYYNRFGLDPNSPSVAKDLGVRAAGVLSDVGAGVLDLGTGAVNAAREVFGAQPLPTFGEILRSRDTPDITPRPATTAAQPVTTAAQPATTAAQPVTTAAQPATTSAQPVTTAPGDIRRIDRPGQPPVFTNFAPDSDPMRAPTAYATDPSAGLRGGRGSNTEIYQKQIDTIRADRAARDAADLTASMNQESANIRAAADALGKAAREGTMSPMMLAQANDALGLRRAALADQMAALNQRTSNANTAADREATRKTAVEQREADRLVTLRGQDREDARARAQREADARKYGAEQAEKMFARRQEAGKVVSQRIEAAVGKESAPAVMNAVNTRLAERANQLSAAINDPKTPAAARAAAQAQLAAINEQGLAVLDERDFQKAISSVAANDAARDSAGIFPWQGTYNDESTKPITGLRRKDGFFFDSYTTGRGDEEIPARAVRRRPELQPLIQGGN